MTPKRLADVRSCSTCTDDVRGRSVVGEILFDGRIEISIRRRQLPPATLKVVFAHPYSPIASALLVSKLPTETEALPPNPCRRLRRGDDLDHAAQLPAVLGRIAAGQDVHRMDVVGADLRREGGRAVVRQRQAVDDVLRLIFGAARMQNAVGFEQPARLRVHEVEQRPAGQRRRALLRWSRRRCGARTTSDGDRAACRPRRDGHLRLNGRQGQRDRKVDRQRRPDLDEAA